MSYTLNGEQYPSVTNVLSQLDKSSALIPWALNCFETRLKELLDGGMEIYQAIIEAKKNYRDVSNTALDIGSQVHHAVEQYVKRGDDLRGSLKPEVENGFLAFLDWEEKNVSKWIESEIRTVNEIYGYAGTYDAIYENKQGVIILLDFKTSKAIYPEYWMQVAAYKKARESLFGEYEIYFEREECIIERFDLHEINIDKCAILRLDKETGIGEYKEREKKNIETYFRAFVSLVDFYYKHKKRRLKGNKIIKNLWSK